MLLLAVYFFSLAPGLTWANSGSDGGDLIAASATGGVAHPTGYPTYLLLARLFQFLPIGSLAYRTNLLSALASALAAGMLCALARRITSFPGRRSELAGWITGMAYGLAPLVWSQSVITEVYALQGLGIVLALWCLMRPPGKSGDLLLGMVLGLLLGVHLTSLLLFPAFIFLRTLPAASGLNRRAAGFALLRQLGGLGIGLLIFVTIPLEALHHPAVNWGDVVTPGRFWWLVSGQMYRDYFSVDLPGSLASLQTAAGYLIQQAGPPGLVLGLIGLAGGFRNSQVSGISAWMFAASLAFVVVYHTEDSFVYLIPATIAFALWIGRGSLLAVHRLSSRMGLFAGACLLVYLSGLALWHWPQVSAAQDRRAETFAREAVTGLPRHAIVLARGDEGIFALWYEQYALRQRTDVAILAEDLLPFDWYRENLRAVYPGLKVPDHPDSVWAASLAGGNPGRPVCYVLSDSPNPIACP